MRIRKEIIVAGCWLAAMLTQVRLDAQVRVRQPSVSSSAGARVSPPTIPAAATLGQPAFDPYATVPTIPPNAASIPPTLPSGSTVVPSQPLITTPNSPVIGGTPYVAPPATTWPQFTDPSTPSYVFPNTGYGGTYSQPSPFAGAPAWCQNWTMPQPQEGRYLRLFQEVRFTNTYLAGGDGTREMGLYEADLATTVNFPNFLWSGVPLHVSPGFTTTWLDGPEEFIPGPPPFPRMPSRLYSAYLGFGWQPSLTPQLSADLEAIFGIYSDFETFTNESLRIQGTGIGVLALTPTTTLKAGVTYLDRVDLKLLPAVGILWTPNPQTRWDIFFPRPKLSHYVTTIGNTDIWMYLNAEYGGGSWTVDRPGADDRRVDINDIRVGGGFEWMHQFGLAAFVEAAYVFDRELVYASGVPDRHPLKDTYMIRGGLVY